MGARADALAEQFERANNDIVALVEGCSEEALRSSTSAEQWSVAVTAHHVASSHEAIAGFLGLIANGQELPPITPEMMDQINAQHAQQYANCGRQETLDLLRANAAAAASVVRGLSDEQLDRTAPMPFLGGAPWSTQQCIENVLIGHVLDHGGSIRTSVG
jgi:hypothetical protein